MPNQFEGNFTTTPTKKIAIVVGKFNESVTRNLADGAIRTLKQFGIKDDQMTSSGCRAPLKSPLPPRNWSPAAATPG